jgi:hypothetical protein
MRDILLVLFLPFLPFAFTQNGLQKNMWFYLQLEDLGMLYPSVVRLLESAPSPKKGFETFSWLPRRRHPSQGLVIAPTPWQDLFQSRMVRVHESCLDASDRFRVVRSPIFNAKLYCCFPITNSRNLDPLIPTLQSKLNPVQASKHPMPP